MSYEEIEVSVAIIVKKRATGSPTSGARVQEASFCGYIGKGAVTIVAIENILTAIGDE